MSLKSEYFCSACNKRQSISTSSLKTCTRCSVVQYCDRICQKNDYKDHKYFCLAAQQKHEGGAKMAQVLRQIDIPKSFGAKWGQIMGDFTNFYNLGQFYFDFAENNNSYLGFEKAAEYFEKLYNEDTNGSYYDKEFLTFIYLRMGKTQKVKHILEKWQDEVNESNRNAHPCSIMAPWNPPIFIAAKLAFKLQILGKKLIAQINIFCGLTMFCHLFQRN